MTAAQQLLLLLPLVRYSIASAQADEVFRTVHGALLKVRERVKTLHAQADERQVLRAEITHYREKVTRLANEGLSNVKAQAKAESNQEKCVLVGGCGGR